MSEVLRAFDETINGPDGAAFSARACGREGPRGLWEGWLEFIPSDDSPVLRTGLETTQPNRVDLVYWADGLRPVYLEGALERARVPHAPVVSVPKGEPAYDAPAPSPLRPDRAPLDPHAVYAHGGEERLHKQLAALSAMHLLRIIRAYRLVDEHTLQVEGLPKNELVGMIVTAVSRIARPPGMSEGSRLRPRAE